MIKTIEYKFKGTRRKVGAIGKPEKFTITVFRQVGTMTPKDAMDTARESMYQDDWEMILFTSCAVRVNRHWQAIPMMEVLGLE
jgi:hypothetical protein